MADLFSERIFFRFVTITGHFLNARKKEEFEKEMRRLTRDYDKLCEIA